MNEFETRLNALRREHKVLMSRIWSDFCSKHKQICEQIRALRNKPGMEAVVASLDELRRMVKADCDRKMSKAGRTYHFENRAICEEMRRWALNAR